MKWKTFELISATGDRMLSDFAAASRFNSSDSNVKYMLASVLAHLFSRDETWFAVFDVDVWEPCEKQFVYETYLRGLGMNGIQDPFDQTLIFESGELEPLFGVLAIALTSIWSVYLFSPKHSCLVGATHDETVYVSHGSDDFTKEVTTALAGFLSLERMELNTTTMNEQANGSQYGSSPA